VNRSCKSCGNSWQVDPIEADWSRSKNTALPRNCPSCRADKRKLVDSTITCSKCETAFAWPKELALFAAMFGWKPAHRCPGGCGGDLEQVKRFRGDMYAIGPVWLRQVKGIDLDAAPVEELTPEQRARAAKVPKLEDLFKDLGSGMGGPSFGDLPHRGAPAAPEKPAEDDLPPENLPSPDSLFSFKK